MKIILEEAEINEAILSHLNKSGINTLNKHIETSFTTGRKANGTSVEIIISAAKPAQEVVVEEVPTVNEEEEIVEEVSDNAKLFS